MSDTCCDKCTPSHEILSSPSNPATTRSHNFTVGEHAVRLTGANLAGVDVAIFKELTACDDVVSTPALDSCGCAITLSERVPYATLLYPGSYYITVSGTNAEDAIIVQEAVTTQVTFLDGESAMSCSKVDYSCNPVTGAVTLTGGTGGPCTMTPGDSVTVAKLPDGTLVLTVNNGTPTTFSPGSSVECTPTGLIVDGNVCDFPTTTVELQDNGDCTGTILVNSVSVGTVVTEAKAIHEAASITSTDDVFEVDPTGPNGQAIDITFNANVAATQLAASAGAITAICNALAADPACLAALAAGVPAATVATGPGISGDGSAGNPITFDPASMTQAQITALQGQLPLLSQD